MFSINKHLLEKVIILISILILFSYGIEPLIGNLELSIFLTVILSIILIIYILFTKKIFSIYYSDIVIFMFIIYIIAQCLFIDDINSAFRIIAASFIFYFIGRFIYLDYSNYLFIKKIVNILSWLIIINLLFQYDVNTSYRISVGDTSPIAIGELMGLFALINLFNPNGLNKNFLSIFNYILGMLVNLIILSSRSSFFFIIIATLMILFSFSKKKMKIILLCLICISLYFILFNPNSFLLNKFSALKRFTIEGMLNDPSIIGSSQDLGRSDLWEMSIDSIKNNPFFGIGGLKIYSHNIFLEVFSSFGLLGISFWILFLVTVGKIIFISNKQNIVLLSLLAYTFLYRQFSFAFDAHKSLFLIIGMMITYCRKNKDK